MSTQNYKNHVRFYAPHHFIFYPIAMAMIAFSVFMGRKNPDLAYVWWFLAALTVLVTWLSFMLRQHYALTLQNRLIRLEVAHRYFVKTGNDFSLIENELQDGQLFALRFASDEEFVALVAKTRSEKLSSTEIKKEIKNWKADQHRV